MIAETAPLLDGGHHEQDQEQGQDQESQPTLLERIENVIHEPLTPLTQVLLIVLLLLLLLSSIFVGLFAGVSHKLELEHRKHNEEARKTVTVTTTVATSHGEMSTATTTWITTTTATTTDRPPIPVPTELPEKVRHLSLYLGS
jgi:endothelin-converting enzyme